MLIEQRRYISAKTWFKSVVSSRLALSNWQTWTTHLFSTLKRALGICVNITSVTSFSLCFHTSINLLLWQLLITTLLWLHAFDIVTLSACTNTCIDKITTSYHYVILYVKANHMMLVHLLLFSYTMYKTIYNPLSFYTHSRIWIGITWVIANSYLV